MICQGCNQRAAHIFSDDRGERCDNCSNLSAASKTKTDGMLTRSSWRIRRQQFRYEGDMIRPHVYDKTTHRERVNPDFLKLYPDKVKEYFSGEELNRDGYKEMPKHIMRNKRKSDKLVAAYKADTQFEGKQTAAMAKFLDRKESEA